MPADTRFQDVTTKNTIVPADRVILIDSQDASKLKQTPATAFVGPTGATGATGPAGANGTGTGDMLLASTQTVTGLKTFLNGTFGLRNIANTITSFFSSAATVARTYTLRDADGTLAFTTDITGVNSGTNTGDNTVATAITGTPSVTLATVTTTGNIELGNASDTTISRVSAGVIAVEGATINGFTTTATSGGTTTLTIASGIVQSFTGSLTQTVLLPTTSVLIGQTYTICNLSTGLITIQSSAGNTITTLGLNQRAIFRALVATPTTAGNWAYTETNMNANGQGKRVLVTTQSATPVINTNNGDIFQITGLAQAITSFTTNLTGTPLAGDMMIIQITDNGTARALTFGASFASTTVALPTTTVISTMLRIGFQRNNANTVWDCIAVA